MGKPNPRTDRELAVAIAKLLRQRKTRKEICREVAIGEKRYVRIVSQGQALKPEAPKKAEKPAAKKPAAKPTAKKAETKKAETKKAAMPTAKKGGCKCTAHVHALAIEGTLLPRFLTALEFACYRIFSLGVEQGKKEKAAAKPPKK